jgi:adenylate kinase family enzyme
VSFLRLTIRGNSGSGKSTLGVALAARLGLPYVELDEHWHLPGRRQRPREEFRERLSGLLVGEAWVMDGDYSNSRDLIIPAADTVIWLDYPLRICFFRVLRRTLRRVIRREVVCNGNRESLFLHFLTRDSLLLATIRTHARRRRLSEEIFADPANAGKQLLHFRHPRETEAWLATLPTKSL